jgi:sugar lactone lactonase YvrE
MEAIGGARLALLDGALYVTNGQFLGDESGVPSPNTAAILRVEDGELVEVANTWDFEKTQNPDGGILDSHPYGITAGPDGYLYVVDAAANDLLKVDPNSGEIELVAVFAGLPSPLPNPARGGAMETDPVPTGVVVDASGAIFVSLLSGFPFVPGSAKVVQVSPDGQVSDYATGLTMLTDVRAAPDGNLYAVQIGLFTEQGPTLNSGRIIRVQPGDASEVVVDGLSFPTSIDFNENGDAYITTNGIGAPGSGELMMFANLTSLPGSPLTEEEAATTAAEEQPAAAEEQPAAAAEQPQPAAAQEAPAALPQAGGEQSATEQLGQMLLGLGVILFAAGLILKRRSLSN